MPEPPIEVVVIDTSVLFRGLRRPDIQKVLQRARDKKLRVVVPKVAWEEWRTQQVAQTYESLKEARRALAQLQKGQGVLSRLPKIEINLPTDEDLENQSREMMASIATENAIEVLGLAPDHAERAWRRYFAFNPEPPFNPEVVREERRKDIPDSWILESCIDLVAQHEGVAAICDDERLSSALTKAGVRVFRRTSELIEVLEASEAAVTPDIQQPVQPPPANFLATTLSDALAQSRDFDRRVLGLIAHFDTFSKEELPTSLGKIGIPAEAAENSARRLVTAGLLRDTGNHYLVPDKRVALAAKASVEADVIALLALD